MNNNDVIEYIRNNSKHPHAALIAEWLLTGCEVEYWHIDREWVLTDSPSWSNQRKYRLVKPKPAYRVYLDEHPRIVERFPDGTYSMNYKDNLQWLSDWIEYDMSKWSNEYIQKVAEIDESAAQWLVDNGHIDGEIRRMFVWGDTPQGHDYWENIDSKL